jgi:hypothetical protein
MIHVIEDLGVYPVLTWQRASASSPSGNCVEVAQHQDRAIVRHSKQPLGPALVFSSNEWACFVIGVEAGEFAMEWGRT